MMIKILSNVAMLPSVDGATLINHSIDPAGLGIKGWWRRVRMALTSYRYDVIFLNCDTRETILTAALLRLLPFNKCCLCASDIILPKPSTFRDRVVARIKRVVLKRVNLFLLVQKDSSGYEKYYGIDTARTSYIPWKVNLLDRISSMSVHEGEFVFAGGTTLRDWHTLAEAFHNLTLPLVICIPDDAELQRRGQTRSNLPRPDQFGNNVRIVRHGGQDDWLEWVAASKFVVLPIDKHSINPSGVSTYLSCMALRKCVIISEGPSTVGILDDSEAVVVPAGDAEALRAAVLRVNSDGNLRHRTAEAGYQYALRCGGEERLYRDFAEQLTFRYSSPVTQSRT